MRDKSRNKLRTSGNKLKTSINKIKSGVSRFLIDTRSFMPDKFKKPAGSINTVEEKKPKKLADPPKETNVLKKSSDDMSDIDIS